MIPLLAAQTLKKAPQAEQHGCLSGCGAGWKKIMVTPLLPFLPLPLRFKVPPQSSCALVLAGVFFTTVVACRKSFCRIFCWFLEVIPHPTLRFHRCLANATLPFRFIPFALLGTLGPVLYIQTHENLPQFHLNLCVRHYQKASSRSSLWDYFTLL